MNDKKKHDLVASIADQSEPRLAPIRQFFDGNDDLGSIGCNLMEHPGIAVFEKILVGLLDRKDVDAVYAQIFEDPGDGCWLFTDTVLVVGDIPRQELQQLLEPLQPDEVAPVTSVPMFIQQRHKAPALYAWWD